MDVIDEMDPIEVNAARRREAGVEPATTMHVSMEATNGGCCVQPHSSCRLHASHPPAAQNGPIERAA
jgi:hypothetical protein